MDFTYASTSRTIRLSQGEVHYHDVGEGPCIFLIHGSGPGVTGWANFEGNLEFFSKEFRCIVIDLPGYGKSDAIAGEPISTSVAVCAEFLKALEVQPAHVIGNSLGAIVGSHIAAQYPDLVSSFITIGGIGLNIFSAFPGEGLNLLSDFAENPSRESIEAWLRSMVYDQSLVTDELIEARFAQATDPKTLDTTRQLYSREALQNMSAFRKLLGSKLVDHLSSIKAPTLITWGRDDRVSPMDIGLLPMRLVPNCEFHIFPDCGHWVMIECKRRFESLVYGFICSHQP